MSKENTREKLVKFYYSNPTNEMAYYMLQSIVCLGYAGTTESVGLNKVCSSKKIFLVS